MHISSMKLMGQYRCDQQGMESECYLWINWVIAIIPPRDKVILPLLLHKRASDFHVFILNYKWHRFHVLLKVCFDRGCCPFKHCLGICVVVVYGIVYQANKEVRLFSLLDEVLRFIKTNKNYGKLIWNTVDWQSEKHNHIVPSL